MDSDPPQNGPLSFFQGMVWVFLLKKWWGASVVKYQLFSLPLFHYNTSKFISK